MEDGRGMNNECPICKGEGRLGWLMCSYDKNSDCWIEVCNNPNCDYFGNHKRSRNIKVDIDRRKNG